MSSWHGTSLITETLSNLTSWRMNLNPIAYNTLS